MDNCSKLLFKANTYNLKTEDDLGSSDQIERGEFIRLTRGDPDDNRKKNELRGELIIDYEYE